MRFYSEFNKVHILNRTFYERDTVVVARELIGHILIRTIADRTLAGIIVETEAYCGEQDRACHAYHGKTERTAPLFGTAGMAYVYVSYGVHFCFNVVSKPPMQSAGGVLIRAIRPILGIDAMKEWRDIDNEKNLANGPGKLTQALQITKANNFHDCTQPNELFIAKGNESIAHIDATPRIGISYAQDKLWRFIARE